MSNLVFRKSRQPYRKKIGAIGSLACLQAMRHRQIQIYFSLLLVQTVGVALIISQGLPVYRRVIAGSLGPHARPKELIIAVSAVGLIQSAYWLRSAAVQSLDLPHNIFLSHIAQFIGRINFIFAAMLFSALIYYRPPELHISSLPQIAVFIGILFSMFCYTLEFERLARALGANQQS